MSHAWLRRARWPRWACRACGSGFVAGAKKYDFGQVAVSLYFSFAKQQFRHIFDQSGKNMKNHQNHFVDTLSMSLLILPTSVSRGFLSEVGHPPNRKPCDTDLSHTGRQGKQKGQASSPRSTQGRATSFVTWRPALYEFSIANKKDAPILYYMGVSFLFYIFS